MLPGLCYDPLQHLPIPKNICPQPSLIQICINYGILYPYSTFSKVFPLGSIPSAHRCKQIAGFFFTLITMSINSTPDLSLNNSGFKL